jgi:predicted transcriptional regulator/predicted RNase H-like HicB family nuclease
MGRMVEIQPIRVELEREEDGRILASVPDLPGVMAYGASEEEAVRRVKAIALRVLADMIESGEEVPDGLKSSLLDREVHFNPELQAKLSRMAAQQGRDAQMLVQEAVERLVDYDDWFLREVDKGVAAADRGEFVEHADVRKMIDARYPG